MHRMTATIVAAFAALTLAAIPACQSNNGAGGGGNGATTNEYVGTLRGNIAAIGGETTGWVLKRPNQPDLEVDISGVRTEAESLATMRVRIRGRIQQREYVERGKVPTLIAERIELAQ